MSCSSLIHNLLNPIVIQGLNHPKYKIQNLFSQWKIMRRGHQVAQLKVLKNHKRINL